MYKRIAVVFSFVAFFTVNIFAQITMPKVFGDNMVLQRDIQIPVWGKATSGATVVAQLGKIQATAKSR